MSDWKPSVTVAAVVERDGRYLFVEEHTPEGLRLNQPAGHLDPGESLVEAVVRETREETAARVVPSALVGVYMGRYRSSRGDVDNTYLRFAFACDLLDEDPHGRLDTGIVRALWLTPDEARARLADHRSPLVMPTLEDALAGRRFPLNVIHTDRACLDV